MKNFFSKFCFKPSQLKNNCENEGKVHKAKIICFSIAMGLVAGSYQGFFDNLTYRSGQFQAQAMAGLKPFANFKNFDDST